MKMFGFSRSTAAGIGALLFVWAQTTAFAQNFGSRPQQAVVSKTDTYLPAAAQMVSQATVQEVVMHPQGRYALIRQNEGALPVGPLVTNGGTGAVALLLYDARLGKTRTLLERRADGGTHFIESVQWLPETDCALVVTSDISPSASIPGSAPAEATVVHKLLFFDFGKTLSPRVLASSQGWTAPNDISVKVSPTKPLFVVYADGEIRMGSAPRGTLGPPASIPYRFFHDFYNSGWDVSGTSIYGSETVKTQPDPDAKPQFIKKWFSWDGKSPNAVERNTEPNKNEIAQCVPTPPSPIALRNGALSIATSLAPSEPLSAPTQQPKAQNSALLHPLYLEATTDPTTVAANTNHSALIAPDADASYLLPDRSAVLYQSSGALYAVPLVHIKTDGYLQAQKAQAIQNAKQMGVGILMYTQDYDEVLPLKSNFSDELGSYLKNDAAVASFTESFTMLSQRGFPAPMKIFGFSRPSAACAAAVLFVAAQTAVFAQNFAARSQIVVAKDDAYLIGSALMIAPANADFVPHPQGRYALITQRETTLPPGPLLGKSTTGAVSLLLYDSKLNKTRTLLQRRADGGRHSVEFAGWLPQTDCAVVVIRDIAASTPQTDANLGGEALNDDTVDSQSSVTKASANTTTLLFYDFQKSLMGRALATNADGFFVSVSPTKPLFFVTDKNQKRMGTAPRGTFGPAREAPSNTSFEAWSAEGTSVYEEKLIATRTSPEARLQYASTYYEWDGQAPDATELKAPPTKAMVAQETMPASLPIVLQVGELPVPPTRKRSVSLSTPLAAQTPLTPTVKSTVKPPTIVLHPLYLEASDDSKNGSANQSALIAPDVEGAYLLEDRSAVLYQSDGALYAVPLVRLNPGAYAQLQKAQAMAKAKQVGLGILMYSQDYDEIFPPQAGFPDVVRPYLRNEAVSQGFTYISPGTAASVASPETTVMGYLATPGGRAVLYVDGHVKWEDKP